MARINAMMKRQSKADKKDRSIMRSAYSTAPMRRAAAERIEGRKHRPRDRQNNHA